MVLEFFNDREVIELKTLYRESRNLPVDTEIVFTQSFTRDDMYEVRIGTPEGVWDNKCNIYNYVHPEKAFEYISWGFRTKIISMKINLLDEVYLEEIEKRIKLKESSLGLLS